MELLNQRIEGSHYKPISFDIYWADNQAVKPIIVFAHGFKGFKDWGHWAVLANAFAEAGYCFIKFNYSHNGTTMEQPSDFADLEAFGNDTYSKKFYDLDKLLAWIVTNKQLETSIGWDKRDITLIGHSLSGGVVLIQGAKDTRIQRVITWASVQSLDFFWKDKPQLLETWQQQGVWYIENARTKQQMPVYYSWYQDFIQHQAAYSIDTALQQTEKPILLIHGTHDLAVSDAASSYLQQQSPNAQLVLIQGADHVFGGSHPYQRTELPPHSQELLEHCLRFLKSS